MLPEKLKPKLCSQPPHFFQLLAFQHQNEIFGTVRNEAVEVVVVEHEQLDNQQYIRKLARASGLSATSIFKCDKFQFFKIKQIQEVNKHNYGILKRS